MTKMIYCARDDDIQCTAGRLRLPLRGCCEHSGHFVRTRISDRVGKYCPGACTLKNPSSWASCSVPSTDTRRQPRFGISLLIILLPVILMVREYFGQQLKQTLWLGAVLQAIVSVVGLIGTLLLWH